MGSLRNFPGRHDRKRKFHSDAEPLVAPEVKAMSGNIAYPAQDRLELLEVGLEPDFDLKVQFVPASCPTFFQFTWPSGSTNSHQLLPLCVQRLFEALAAETRLAREVSSAFSRATHQLHPTTCAPQKRREHSKQRLVAGFASHPIGPPNRARCGLRFRGFCAEHKRHSAFPIKLDSQLKIEIVKGQGPS